MLRDESTNNTVQELEVMEPMALEQITRAEVDTAIATAHKFPRSLARFKKAALEMATLDEETAASCLYKLPRKDHGKMKYIEGESVRMAEIVASCYGNIQGATRLISQNKTRGTVQGICRDLENNVTMTGEVHFRTTTKDGVPYSDDMQLMAANAAGSKARRNAIFCVVPRALVKSITEAAREVALGKGATMRQRREKVMTWLESLNIDLNRVWTALEIKGAEEDITLDHLTTLTGIRTALRDNETTIDEAFPVVISEKKMAAPTNGAGATKPQEPAATAPSVEKHDGEPTTGLEYQDAITKEAAQKGISFSDLVQALKVKKFIKSEGSMAALPMPKLREIYAAREALFAEIITSQQQAGDPTSTAANAASQPQED